MRFGKSPYFRWMEKNEKCVTKSYVVYQNRVFLFALKGDLNYLLAGEIQILVNTSSILDKKFFVFRDLKKTIYRCGNCHPVL